MTTERYYNKNNKMVKNIRYNKVYVNSINKQLLFAPLGVLNMPLKVLLNQFDKSEKWSVDPARKPMSW